MDISKSHYYSQFEKELILALAKPYMHIIENKEMNRITTAEKPKAYDEIAKQFNATDGVNPGTVKQIRQCYYNFKKKLRQSRLFFRQEQWKTDGGQVPKDVQISEFELSYLAEPMLTMPMSTPWDSDTSQMEIQNYELLGANL
ncbi:unnamed protein product [Larinioides sclopetarius]|uniref:Regulatory protein zeste n=1 Tax=Larinioides sclopetarius TaxID=280406 RepID=A0AAV2A453_9ARAC